MFKHYYEMRLEEAYNAVNAEITTESQTEELNAIFNVVCYLLESLVDLVKFLGLFW